MRLDDIIQIPSEGTHKFILVDKVLNGTSQTLFIASKNGENHKTIYKNLIKENPTAQYKVRGGGYIDLDLKTQLLLVYGTSKSYGTANQKEVSDILSKWQKPTLDYEIIARMGWMKEEEELI